MIVNSGLIDEFEKRKGSELTIFLNNGFRYKGVILNILDSSYILISDEKSGKEKLISINQIAEVNFDG